jgi:glycosyltransferase involved in cell wall biosynthesis
VDGFFTALYNAAPGDLTAMPHTSSAMHVQVNSSPPELSIVIPAFNEKLRLPKTLERIHDYLAARSVCAEVIVVDDGSTDGLVKLVEGFQRRYPEIRLVRNPGNRGKGYSVRHGMREARGKIALFTDADLATPIEEADKLLANIRENHCDSVIGSRGVDRSLIEIHESTFREVAGMVFNRLVRWSLGIDFRDTQCGFKAFRLDRARVIFEQQRIEGFGFDAEILFLARRHGLHVLEIPVRWAHQPDTKVNVGRDAIRMFCDLLAIRWNTWAGHYPRRKEA